MIKKLIANEPVLYLSILLIAGLIRFFGIATLPLNLAESTWAVQALDVARGAAPEIGQHLGYTGLTSILFYAFSATEFTARFFPALFGSLLVLVPLLFKRWLGKFPAVLLALGLAIEPVLIGVSVQAGTPVLAVFGLALLAGGWLARKPALAGIGLALGLMADSSFWFGVVVLGFAWAIARLLKFDLAVNDEEEKPLADQKFYVTALISFVLTVGIVGSCFFRFPAGITSLFSGLITFFKGFATPATTPFWLPLFALVTYSPLPVIIGLVAGIFALFKKNALVQFMLIWLLVGLIFIVLYPQQDMQNLVWVVLPAWVILVQFVVRLIAAFEVTEDFPIMLGVSLVTLTLCFFFAFSLRKLFFVGQPADISAQYIKLLGAVVVILLCFVLLAFFWSVKTAAFAVGSGVAGFLLVMLFSNAFGVAGFHPASAAELLRTGDQVRNVTALQNTLTDLSMRKYFDAHTITINVIADDGAEMRWLLRNHPNTSFHNNLAMVDQADVIITAPGLEVATTSGYQGRDVLLAQTITWNNLIGGDYLKWYVFREAPLVDSKAIILWARQDLIAPE